MMENDSWEAMNYPDFILIKLLKPLRWILYEES